MKKFYLLSLLALAACFCFGQDRNNEDEVVKIDWYNQHATKEGELIVKFADHTTLQLKNDERGTLQTTGINKVDALLQQYPVTKAERLCPNDDPKRELKTSKSYNGPDVVERDLSRLCRFVMEDPRQTYEMIEALKELREVEFAEPNYMAFALGMEAENASMAPPVTNGGKSNRDGGYFNPSAYTSEPMYSLQWGLQAVNLPQLWAADNNTNTDRPVIAILDTGVDIQHPDLDANIWTNPVENENGYDDDNNGFADDIHGWDFINQTADMHDYNSHGTHCAGIAAAVGDNGMGMTGANPMAYIMPVAVLQSNGTGDIATVIQGINYAKNNGANIISMSFGTYGYSIAMEQALAQAYQNCVLVAAAGNDGRGIDPRCALMGAPMFPAAFTFVFGVEATTQNGGVTGWTNYDCDGPTFSQFDEEQLYNYELQAPGASIYSTVPNGNYKCFNGTSMAAPLVAGGISVLLHAKPYASQEMLWGDLINTAGNHVDFMACYEAGEPPVQLQFVTYEMNDTVGGDGDYRPDAGETIDFYPTLRNTWGATNNITMWLELDEYENPDIVTFLDNDPVPFGHGLSAYAKSKSANPIRFTVNPDCVDGRNINMELHAVATAGMNYAPVATIGQGTTTNNYLPFNTYYSYSMSQMLFKASELSAAGLVAGSMNSLSFQTNSALGYTRNNISIWMANVSQNEVNNPSVSTQGMACVYSGSLTQVQGWNDFAFNGADFSWDGTSNVLITVVMNHGSYNSSIPWLCNNPGFKACAYNYSNNTPYNPSNNTYTLNTTSNYRPNIKFNAAVPNGGEPTELVVPFTIQVENGVELGGMISDTMILYPNTHYIVTSNLGITENGFLIIKPGTKLIFKDGIGISSIGHIYAIGTPDSLISFTTNMLWSDGGRFTLAGDDTLEYCIIDGFYYTTTQSSFGNRHPIINHSIIRNCYINYSNIHNIIYNYCCFYYNSFYNNGLGATDNFTSLNNNYNFIHNRFSSNSSFHLRRNIDNNCNWFEQQGDFEFHTSESFPNIFSIKHFYLGSSREDIIRKRIYDFEYPGCNSFGIINLDSINVRPIAEAHGIVWKVVVNGYDAQDEFEQLPPLGCGRHKFEVYFNRPMDTSVTPMIAMGVRPPYTQHAIAEDGSWNADGTIYTAYLTIDGTTATDGLNRIYVANARDNEHFEIPVEDFRFNVQVSSAGSLSNEFMATPGLGKVELEWNNNEVDFEDFLGYNMYRYVYDSVPTNWHYDDDWNWVCDSVWMPTDSIQLNTTLIQDTLFTDYNVLPGQRYYYYYKVLRTNLTESEASLTVTTVPLTSIPGDANGSMAVDVADVVSLVSYLTNGNPQPFIFEAADINTDGTIDILDIVGVINIITNRGEIPTKDPVATAYYSIETGILYVDTPIELGGVQFIFNNLESLDDLEPLSSLQGFENVKANVTDGALFMAYSMSGKRLPAGKHALLRIGNAKINSVALSDPQGHNVLAIEKGTGIQEYETLFLQQPYPNPFNGNLTIPFIIGDEKANDVVFTVTNIMGQVVSVIELGSRTRGEYQYEWTPAANLATGIYTVSMQVSGRKVQHAKVVYVK
jgi:subtilisin family serine protease